MYYINTKCFKNGAPIEYTLTNCTILTQIQIPRWELFFLQYFSKSEQEMTAASLFMPSLGIWNSNRPGRIKHSPKYNVRRRQRITPPLTTNELIQRFNIDRDLEILQGENHDLLWEIF